MKKLKRRIFQTIEPAEDGDLISKVFDLVIIALIVVNILAGNGQKRVLRSRDRIGRGLFAGIRAARMDCGSAPPESDPGKGAPAVCVLIYGADGLAGDPAVLRPIHYSGGSACAADAACDTAAALV